MKTNFNFKKHDGHAKLYISENHKEATEGDILTIRVFDDTQFGFEIYKKGWGIGNGKTEIVNDLPENVNIVQH